MTQSRQLFYCSTSNVGFETEEELRAHYKSAWHRYNLKRKVAGLPPVTREWFELRQAQARANEARRDEEAAGGGRVYVCPLTKKKFGSEGTYAAHVKTKKFKALMKQAGLTECPEPIVRMRNSTSTAAAAGPDSGDARAQDSGRAERHDAERKKDAHEEEMEMEMEEDDDDEEEGDWESCSDEEEAERLMRDLDEGNSRDDDDDDDDDDDFEWDCRRCFFSNRIHSSMADNLEYMFRNYGFSIPDGEFLVDAEGLMRYLGAKLAVGHIPFYVSGLQENAKHFGDVHAVQRHMIDTGRCKMLYEDNEEEYEDFYDYSSLDGDDESSAAMGEGGALAVPTVDVATNGVELVLSSSDATGRRRNRVIGAREFHRYYRQRHRTQDTRLSVAATKAAMLSRYEMLGVATKSEAQVMKERAEKASRRGLKNADKLKLRAQLRRNKNDNLPQFVPY